MRKNPQFSTKKRKNSREEHTDEEKVEKDFETNKNLLFLQMQAVEPNDSSYLHSYSIEEYDKQWSELERKGFHKFQAFMKGSIPQIFSTSIVARNVLEYGFLKTEIRQLQSLKRKPLMNEIFLSYFILENMKYENPLINFEEHDPSMFEGKSSNGCREWFICNIYPHMSCNTSVDAKELIYLSRFARVIQYLMRYLTPKNHKVLFMNVAARLEGSQKVYLLGGHVSLETQRRLEIFELITQVSKRFRSAKKINQKPTRLKDHDVSLPEMDLEFEELLGDIFDNEKINLNMIKE